MSKNSKNELSNQLKTKASPRSIFRSVSSNKINADAAYGELLPKFMAAKKVSQKKLVATSVSLVVTVLVLVVVTVITFSPNANSTSTVVLPKDVNETEVLGETETVTVNNATETEQNVQNQTPATTQEYRTDFTLGNASACNFNAPSNIGTAATLEKVAYTDSQPLTVNTLDGLAGIETIVKENKVMVGNFNKTGNFYMNSKASGYTYCYQDGSRFIKNDVSMDGSDLLVGTESI